MKWLKKSSLALCVLCACLPTSLTAKPTQWQRLDQQHLLYLNTDQGSLVILLAPQFAPNTVAQVRQLVQSGFYTNTTFYRVIDNFVAQFGVMQAKRSAWPEAKAVPAEFSWPLRQSDTYLQAQKPELFADETGFNHHFAVARSNGQEWLVHCPGVVSLARSSDPNSGTTEIAIMMGQAPRHLDRNMNIFGKVVWGSEVLNRLARALAGEGGGIADEARRSVIQSAYLGSDLAPEQQLPLELLDYKSAEFAQFLQSKRVRDDAFFVEKGNGALDVCSIDVPVRVKNVE